MAKKLGIGVIHGMGTHGPEFAKDMIEEIGRRIKNKHGKDETEVAWQPIHWSDILEQRQTDYLEAIKAGANVDYIKLRGFLIKALGDSSAYQRIHGQANDIYTQIHARIGDHIATLRNEVNDDSAPLIILAHSLGGHMMSNYIYDLQNNMAVATAAANDFEQFKTFAGFITFGCNIPLFTLAYDPVVAINFPPPEIVGTPLGAKAKWRNYYDPDDILGYPLKLIGRPPAAGGGPSYDDVVDEDIPINVGGWLSSWNPVSHNGYWTDNDFTKPVAKFIAGFL